MHIDIHARQFSLTQALRRYADMRVRTTLTCFSEHIQHVVVRVSDINGPRGGSDKRCQVHILLSGLTEVVVEDTQADLYLAINRAVERAGRTVKRRLARHRNIHKQTRNDQFNYAEGGNAV